MASAGEFNDHDAALGRNSYDDIAIRAFAQLSSRLRKFTPHARIVAGSDVIKRWLMYALLSLLLLSQPLMGQERSANSSSWSGVIVNSGCTADEGFEESPKCTENRGPYAKLSLYDDSLRTIYALAPQDQAVGHLGDVVTVKGALHDNVIQVTSIKVVTDIGLAVGRKAPAFTARDQFGHEQNLATLKGPKGTVLLFVRSADW